MQKFELLLNTSFTGSPLTVSELELNDDYFVYTQSLGGGVTSEFNIRGYLNDSQNQIIIDGFVEYLNQNSSDIERKEIFYDDRKLSIIFNQFFQTTISNGTPSPTVFIDNQLVNTINIIVSDNNFNWDGNEVVRPDGAPASIIGGSRINSTRNTLYEFTSEDSYYLPIKIYKNYDKTSIETYKVCGDVIDVQIDPELAESYLSGIIDQNSDFFEQLESVSPSNPGESNIVSSVLQCFVDTNLETNENVIFSNNALGVSFTEQIGMYTEGLSYGIPISLSQPSVRGIEEIEIEVEYLSADSSDITILDNLVVKWEEGEQVKNIRITINNDINIEETEMLTLKISSFFNVYLEKKYTHTMNLIDNTVLRNVSFSNVAVSSMQDVDGLLEFNLNAEEGETVNLQVSLDQASIGGESVEVYFFYISRNQSAPINETDFRLLSPQTITWGVGELNKIVEISTLKDNIPESVESIGVRLINPIGVNLGRNAIIKGLINIQDSTIIRKNVAFNIGNIYRQKGRMASELSSTQLRVLTSEATNENSNSWLVKMGNQYNEATQGFDQSFNSFPNFNFGFDTEDNLTSRIDLIITNNGESIIFNEQEVLGGEDFSIQISDNNYQFFLPTNSELGSTVVQIEGASYYKPVYLKADYGMRIKYTHPTIPVDGIQRGFHNFIMKGSPPQQTVGLGEFSLTGTEDPFNNIYNLQTTYDNMSVTYEEGGLCTEGFEGDNHKHKITINGIALLDDYNNDTNYNEFNFKLSTLLNTICPTTNGFDGETGSWESVPYELFTD